MAKGVKCEICGAPGAFIQWTPFETIVSMSDVRHGQILMESIRICETCKSRVYKLQRSNSEAFYGCQTLEDIIRTVREEIK